MQLKSNNNACKTPNLAVCITTNTNENAYETHKHSSQENSKIRVRNHQELLEDH